MKKVFLSIALGAAAFAASAQIAQIKSVDAQMGLRDDAGLGVGVTLDLYDSFELAPAMSLYFPSSGTLYTIEANLHYLLPVDIHENLELYPLGGLGFFHNDAHGESYNRFLLNAGFGARWHISDDWATFTEEKIQIINGFSSNLLMVGISYKF